MLTHRGVRYLATEQEKLDYFTGALKFDASQLPAKLYRSSTSAEACARYFVDKYPIFLSPEHGEGSAYGAPPVVSFCFVDEGMVSLSRFETYLSQYRFVFGLLPGFHLVYVAASDRLFEAAERVFENFLRRDSVASRAATCSPQDRLLQYFEARRLYETGQLESFDRAKLVRLRQARSEFSSEKHEELYARWKVTEPGSGFEILKSDAVARPHIIGAFSTILLEYD